MAETPRRRRIRVEIGEARMDSGATGAGVDATMRDADSRWATPQNALEGGLRGSNVPRPSGGATRAGERSTDATVRARRRKR
jgi:hypothetical protein